MDLSSLLRQDHVVMSLASKTSIEAIQELAQVLRGADGVVDFDAFLNGALEREKEQTTGAGDCIALPHARTDAVSQMVVALGLSKEGIDFQSADGKPVRIVFLIGVPLSSVTPYIRFLARLTKVFCNPSSRDMILGTADAQTLMALIRGLEANPTP